MENKSLLKISLIISLYISGTCYAASRVDDFKMLWNHYRFAGVNKVSELQGDLEILIGDQFTDSSSNIFDPLLSHLRDVEFSRFEKFWNVTPKSFFLGLTNLSGALKLELMSDMATGSSSDIRSLLGYRFLPIRSVDIRDKMGALYPVLIRVKLFMSKKTGKTIFNIHKTNDLISEEEKEFPYDERLLKFTLFFDAPVEISSKGEKIRSIGRIKGAGVWHHYETEGKGGGVEDSHPDFFATIRQKTKQTSVSKDEVFKLNLTNLYELYPSLSSLDDDELEIAFVKIKLRQLLYRRGLEESLVAEDMSKAGKVFFVTGKSSHIYQTIYKKILEENGYDFSLEFEPGKK